MGKEIYPVSSPMGCCFWLLLLLLLPSIYCQVLDERISLLEFKKSFPDPNGILNNWNAAANSNHCSWFGVSCNFNSRVSAIRIGGNFSLAPSCSFTSELTLHRFGIERKCYMNGALGGRLSAVIGNLSEIRFLSLPFNDLSGEIPVEIWGLCNLEVLDLEGNYFNGNFSGFNFTCLRKLRILNLAFNRIFGQFPPSLGNCRSLRILNMAGNVIDGRIPRFLRCLLKLRVLNLSFNQLVGFIPDIFDFGCENLVHLDFSSNSLNGEIPRALGKCRHLRTLLLSSNGLRGAIPHELGKLKSLRVLDVSRNLLSGRLPANLGNCTDLSILVLTDRFDYRSRKSECNSFEGSVLDEIGKLPKLEIVWGPGAGFRGDFPSNWASCKSVAMVNLAQNFLIGDISGAFSGCPELHYLDLSSNNLTGTLGEIFLTRSVPMFDLPSFKANICHCKPPFNPSVAYFLFFSHKVLSEYVVPFSKTRVQDFTRNKIRWNQFCNDSARNKNIGIDPGYFSMPLIRHLTDEKLEADSLESGEGSKGISHLAVAMITFASVVAALLLAFVVLFCYSRRRKRCNLRIEISLSPHTNRVTVFNEIGVPLTYETIIQATESFSTRNCIGSGGFGSTYRAEIAPGNTVAVKRLTAERQQGAPQFHAEVTTLGRIRHQNLITLIGYYANETEMFLIYNYLPGGNLDQFIRGRTMRAFNWATLHKIALHIASALSYLHDQCNPPILHLDIKPSNILLDDDNNAYLSDFGQSKILAAAPDATTCVAGTYGYVAPEYALTGCVSSKADVYSYGVVLLELISDKKALDPSFYSHRDGFNIVSWACLVLDQGKEEDAFLACLWESGPRDKLVRMLHLALLCTSESLSARPTMKQVVHQLEQIQ